MTRRHDKTRLRHIARDARNLTSLKHLTAHLIGAWSYAMNPAIARTDKDHGYCRKLARAIDKRLARMGIVAGVHYRVTEEGDRYCL